MSVDTSQQKQATRERGQAIERWRRVEQVLSRSGWQWTAAVSGLVGSVAVAIAALVVGPLPGNRPQTWWFSLPDSWLRSNVGQVLFSVVFYAGMLLLILAWLVVGIGVRRGDWRIRQLWLLGAIWVLPWVVAPVALTTDIYTYLGQGLVANSGLDPYLNGPGAVPLPDVLHTRIAPPVLDVPSPYGPIFVTVGRVFAPLATDHVVRGILLLRLVEIIGLALTAVSVPRVARAIGASPVTATWIGVTSPVVLASGVLSGHNDLLMIGLLMAALALATRSGPWAMPAAMAVATLAALVKAPAAVGVIVIGLGWARRSPTVRAGLGRLGAAVGITVVVAAVVSVATGLNAQWLNLAAVQSPTTLSPPFTPVQAVANALFSLGIGGSPQGVLHVTGMVTEVLAAVFAVLVLWRAPRLGDVRAIGLIFAAVVLSSPVVWPWYLIWPVMMLAATRQGRGRFTWIALSSVALFAVQPDGAPQNFRLLGTWILALLTVAAFVAGGRFAYRRLVVDPPPQRV